MSVSLPAGYDSPVIGFRRFGAPDLSRRGLTAAVAPPAVLLLDVEAELTIGGVWHEAAFPVAELARELALWLSDDGRGDFAFVSMSYDVPGAVRIVEGADGWRVGSVFAPEPWTEPLGWPELAAEVARFVGAVREGVRALGAQPGFIPALSARRPG